ncbi:hypothetical protein B0H13DRAFT_1922872 [Mycena leptocephala]|nr:hypothetical protein B0H13DRAFT_1922872 [Mycena leptocephala]
MSGPYRAPAHSPPLVYKAPLSQYDPEAQPVDLSSSPVPPRLRPLTPIESQEAHLNSDVFPASLFPSLPHQHMAFPVNDADSSLTSGTGSHAGRVFCLRRAKAPATRQRRKPAVKAASPDVDSEDDDLKEFEIVLHVFPQVKKPAGRAKSRVARPEPVKFGPISADVGVDYVGLMEKFAKAMGSEVPFLIASSVEWRWMKPANSQFVPLRDEDGASGGSIIVKMDAPVKKPATQLMSGPSLMPVRALCSKCRRLRVCDDGPKKKVPFDEGLEEEMEKLAERYPPGVCSEHPMISCYHDRLSDLHFELDRNRKIVWAAAIPCVTSAAAKESRKFIQGSNGSNLFTAKKAIKKASGPPAAGGFTSTPPVIPPTLSSHPTQPQFPFWQNAYAYPPPMPGYPGFPPMPYPPSFPNYPSFDRHSKKFPLERDSSPSPPVLGWLLATRARELQTTPAYPNLPPGLKPLLQKLGFEIGDDITVIRKHSGPRWISLNSLQPASSSTTTNIRPVYT